MVGTFDDEERGERRRGMLSIGQFSRLTGLTLKTIRPELQILVSGGG